MVNRKARGRMRRNTPAPRAVYARRRATALASATVLAVLLATLALPSAQAPRAAARKDVRAFLTHHAQLRVLLASLAPVVTVPVAPGSSWTAVASVGSQPVAWLAQRGGVTLMRFDQAKVRVDLHAGSLDGGTTGWTYGDQITGREVHRVIAGFNGGFKLTYSNVGFVSGGHVAVPLNKGLASVVTYTNGTTDIGAWGAGVPNASEKVYSVLQNQLLLVSNALAAPTVSTCITTCWGNTIQNLTVVARSALGITASGELIWAAGEHLTPASLASALIAAGVVRAIELDINPDWVAGYLYVHHAGGPVANPVVPGQLGIVGQLLAPDTRDFLTVVAR
jgi:hypothetical protein